MSKQVNYSKYQKRVIKFLNELLDVDTPFTYERTQNNHLKVLIDGVDKPLYTGSTPSDRKSLNNFIAEVKRAIKVGQTEVEEIEQPSLFEKNTLANLSQVSHDKLIKTCVKALRARLDVLKEQEEKLVLDEQCMDGIEKKRTEIIKSSVAIALQNRKNCLYITAKEKRSIEEMVRNNLDFMLPSLENYATQLNSIPKFKNIEPHISTRPPGPMFLPSNIVSIETKSKKALAKEAKKQARKANQLVINDINIQDCNPAAQLMDLASNNRVSMLRNLTKSQAMSLIDDINQAMAENKEEDIQSVMALIRDKEILLDEIIARMGVATTEIAI